MSSAAKKTEHKAMAALRSPDAKMVHALREGFGLTQTLFARLTGHSIRSIASWEKGTLPYPAARQRLRELSRLHRGLAEVMKPASIPRWLLAPNDAFEGLSPLEVIERGEVDRLWEMVYLLRSGMPC